MFILLIHFNLKTFFIGRELSHSPEDSPSHLNFTRQISRNCISPTHLRLNIFYMLLFISNHTYLLLMYFLRNFSYILSFSFFFFYFCKKFFTNEFQNYLNIFSSNFTKQRIEGYPFPRVPPHRSTYDDNDNDSRSLSLVDGYLPNRPRRLSPIRTTHVNRRIYSGKLISGCFFFQESENPSVGSNLLLMIMISQDIYDIIFFFFF